jgi:hypothetical protein
MTDWLVHFQSAVNGHDFEKNQICNVKMYGTDIVLMEAILWICYRKFGTSPFMLPRPWDIYVDPGNRQVKVIKNSISEM